MKKKENADAKGKKKYALRNERIVCQGLFVFLRDVFWFWSVFLIDKCFYPYKSGRFLCLRSVLRKKMVCFGRRAFSRVPLLNTQFERLAFLSWSRIVRSPYQMCAEMLSLLRTHTEQLKWT